MDNPDFLNEASLQLPDGLATSLPQYMSHRKTKSLGGSSRPRAGDYNISVQVSDQTFSKAWSSALDCRVYRRSVCAENSGNAFSSPASPLSPKTDSFKLLTSNIPPATSPSPASNGIGSGCSLFCRWLQVFCSRVFLELKYEMARRHRPGLSAGELSRISRFWRSSCSAPCAATPMLAREPVSPSSRPSGRSSLPSFIPSTHFSPGPSANCFACCAGAKPTAKRRSSAP